VADKIKSAPATPVRSLGHGGATRPNIPTAELESFVKDEEKRPTILRYPRDPTLDPQLVWKGKDEQDGHDLEVPAVPIYIQETIDPLALIEDLRSTSEGRRTEQQLDFFGAYSDRPIEEKVDFYRHSNKWSNRMILGDSLLVMTSLAEKEGLKGQVQTIYVDPPYGIKFGSNWQVSTRKRDVRDGKDTDLTRQPEQVRAYRDTWELGIHSYLSYLRDRLVVARELLTESGSIFVQIGDENQHLVRNVLDDVFGSSNFVGMIAFLKTGGLVQRTLPATVDYLMWYARDQSNMKVRQLFAPKNTRGDTDYSLVELADGTRRRMTRTEIDGTSTLPTGSKVFQATSLESANPTFSFGYRGKAYTQRWKTNVRGLAGLAAANRLFEAASTLRYMRYLEDFPVMPITNVWADTGSSGFRDPNVYVVQTVDKVIAAMRSHVI
jgi:adenine-specific DNA-methyltransferase